LRFAAFKVLTQQTLLFYSLIKHYSLYSYI